MRAKEPMAHEGAGGGADGVEVDGLEAVEGFGEAAFLDLLEGQDDLDVGLGGVALELGDDVGGGPPGAGAEGDEHGAHEDASGVGERTGGDVVAARGEPGVAFGGEGDPQVHLADLIRRGLLRQPAREEIAGQRGGGGSRGTAAGRTPEPPRWTARGGSNAATGGWPPNPPCAARPRRGRRPRAAGGNPRRRAGRSPRG